ncbi:hypothetical protein EOPP23_04815 [Endozoicomonas sp. OPT23]|uniref:hypothetical protein n=1 Tax=Endozoicomonas sp. OPT23 TaxID=2072845 RepID=UPI00129BA32F|nr:hypothetical protein [Endozoicomonas sp. OPT23]MRI32316.1 hypothetical protein [Endozoicomonas sp. OPT23]
MQLGRRSPAVSADALKNQLATILKEECRVLADESDIGIDRKGQLHTRESYSRKYTGWVGWVLTKFKITDSLFKRSQKRLVSVLGKEVKGSLDITQRKIEHAMRVGQKPTSFGNVSRIVSRISKPFTDHIDDWESVDKSIEIAREIIYYGATGDRQLWRYATTSDNPQPWKTYPPTLTDFAKPLSPDQNSILDTLYEHVDSFLDVIGIDDARRSSFREQAGDDKNKLTLMALKFYLGKNNTHTSTDNPPEKTWSNFLEALESNDWGRELASQISNYHDHIESNGTDTESEFKALKERSWFLSPITTATLESFLTENKESLTELEDADNQSDLFVRLQKLAPEKELTETSEIAGLLHDLSQSNIHVSLSLRENPNIRACTGALILQLVAAGKKDIADDLVHFLDEHIPQQASG